MVQDDRPAGLDGVQVKFDDERVVCDAGVMLVATLAERLGIEALAQRLVRLRRDGAGAANAGRKVMALVYAMVLGADSIDDTGLLRAGRTRRLLGGWVPAPSTLGTFLRAFTFGHVRQLDALLGQSLERAWAAGAGPGSGRLVIDVDSFVGEVCGRLKQGAGYGYTHLLGYHPILATRADTREALHIRLRKGSANTQRGIERFTDELIARVTRAGATGVKLLRADSGFWNSNVFKRLEKAGWQYSIGIRMIKSVRAAVEAIDEDSWTTLAGLPRRRRGADRRNDVWRPAADRQAHPPGRRPGRTVARLATLLLPHQPQRRDHARRGRAPRPRRRRAGHSRPQRPGSRALPLRPVQRQRRLDGARRARTQPAPMDATARAPRHTRTRRPHPAPLATERPRPPDPPRPRLDAPPPSPLALAQRVRPRPRTHPRAPRPRLTPTSKPGQPTATPRPGRRMLTHTPNTPANTTNIANANPARPKPTAVPSLPQTNQTDPTQPKTVDPG